MNLIKPNKLKEGDTIAIIAPAGEVDEERINFSQKYFKSKGYNVKFGAHLNKKRRYLAGDDNERIEDIHSAFEDSTVDAIICARGGYGAIRLINNIDYNIIRNNPKIFCGYSDITALSAMILKKAGLITFSGPMAQSDFGEENINKFTESQFWNTLTNKGSLMIQNINGKIYRSGQAKGITFGGNLSTIASLCGIDFLPDEKFIFFAEDINEDVYKIDRYFRQLLNISKFKNNISGILLGEFINNGNSTWLDELFTELSTDLNIPVYSGYQISHDKNKFTIPIGAEAELNNGLLKIQY